MSKRLVPITREYLRKHYESLVIDPEPTVFAEIRLSSVQICNSLHLCLQRHDSKYTDLRTDIQFTAPKRSTRTFSVIRQCEILVTEILTGAGAGYSKWIDNADVSSWAALAKLKHQMSIITTEL